MVKASTADKAPAARIPHAKPASESKEFADHLSDGFREADEHSIHICKVPDGIETKYDLAAAFEDLFGQVMHVHIESDRGHAMVHFEDPVCAEAALEVQVAEVCGE